MSVVSSITARRCGTCRRQKQKCTWTLQDDACDRCLEKGFSCPPQKGTPGFRLPVRSLFKCDYCRRAHETCHPVDRKWPDKCEFCVARDYPCSAPRTKKQFDGFRTRHEDEESIAETNVESDLQHPKDEEITTLVPSVSKPASELSDSDDSDSRAFTTDLPPVKRVKACNADTEPSTVEEVKQLRGTIRTMEGEFQEVLKAEQEKHQADIKTLKDKHQEELDQQRERYESRIDDLIKIMKKL
ncbi:hypothetical protein F4781DRAFT_379615 [Annulohypoxylon bovei var. microspora]|nr:hypothetical protein F4781DRAFT_379615 [Annulohypoxylon bovei var. microspora]